MRNRIFFTTILLQVIVSSHLFAQLPSSLFKIIEIRIDTAFFDSELNTVEFNGETHLYFEYYENNPTCEIKLFLRDSTEMDQIKLLKSNDYELIDTLINFNDEYLRFRIKFRDLGSTDFLNFTFAQSKGDSLTDIIHIIPLLPESNTIVDFKPKNKVLFVGEEKDYEIITNNIRNIRINPLWTEGRLINYRLNLDNGRLKLHLLSENLGDQKLQLKLQTKNPYISDSGTLHFDLPIIEVNFLVKESRLRFLSIDADEIILNHENLEGYDIQLDNNPTIKIGRTYRIENQEEPGGPLMAEIFTKRYLNNGKVLCTLRPYSLHDQSDGYLFIKDNEIPRFITNFNIIPKTKINTVQILRKGSDWTTSLNVFPGETIEVQFSGESLHRAHFIFDGIRHIRADTIINNQSIKSYVIRIPVNIYNKSIPIYNNDDYTGIDLNVREYQRPREFDFISIEGNGFKRELASMSNTVFAENLIQDIFIQFDREKIDSEGKLYGKQYLNIKITIRGNKNELVELEELEDIVVCPGENSPRSSYYTGNCTLGQLIVNNFLSKKTYDLEEWSKVIIEISHDKSKYGGEGYSKRLEVILQKFWRFDIDVSFPAGLLTFGEESSGSLTGISLAMIAQFSFYEKNKINRYKPYKIGFGVIALDAFNFSDNSDNRDLALVVIGSLYPTRKDKKLTFPLYFGGGYKLKREEFFFLVGPGIRVSL